MISSQHYCLAAGIFALFLSGCSQFKSRKVIVPGEIFRTTKPSVVLINYENRGGHGSGFFVPGKKSLCTVLTARHVIDNSDNLQLKTQDGNIWGNLEVKPFSSHDLAIIIFKPLEKKCPYQPLKLGDSDQVSEGDQVYISGYFESSGNLVKHFVGGNVTAISQLPEGYGISYAATTGGGMSGGPVLNRFGEVIAIHGRSDTEIRQLAEIRGESLPQLQQFEPEKFGSTINTFKWGIPTHLYLANIPAEFETGLEEPNSIPRKQKIEETDQDAETSFKGIALNNIEAEVWYNRGNSLRKVEKYNEAIELNPNYADAWYNLGNSLSELGKYDEAIASYDKAIELNPNYTDAWYNLGNSLSKLGKYNEAIASYDKAIELNPNYTDAWYNLGNSLSELGKYDEALASYDKAIELKPAYSLAWNNRGWSLESLKRYDEALKSYKNAIELDPDLEIAVNNRQRLLERLGY